MDFNTERQPEEQEGSSPEPEDESRTRSGGGGEFTYTDPVQSFLETVRRLVQGPTDFFQGITRAGDFINPAIFAVICYEVFVILSGILALAGISGDQGFGGLIASIILAPIFLAIGLLIGSGIIHLLVRLVVGPRNAGFEATFRVVAYSQVVNLVSWIPFIGPLLGLYGIYLGVIGVREVHGTSTGKAALVVLIPAAVVLLLVLMLVLLVGAALFFGTRS
jgi:hypothetical protein